MAVDFIPAAHVHAVSQRIGAARQRAVDQCGPPPQVDDTNYWESLFEANAAEVLSSLPEIALTGGRVVRYRYFGRHGGDLLVRPFVAGRHTDVAPVRRVLDWHPAPDSILPGQRSQATQDVEFLYRHFAFDRTPVGVFDYWLAMQEIWASARWAHSHLIASADELSQITSAEGWEVAHPVQTYEPAVVDDGASWRIAALVQSPLVRHAIHLQQVGICSDHAVEYGEPLLVASGPRGYIV